MATLELDGVGKTYRRGVVAVRDVSLKVEDGELVSLVGPSGCGKSTTLNLIAGLETATEGTLKIDGAVVNHLSPRERDIAMVFQSYALYPHMNVRRNLGFALEVAGIPRKEREARVDEAAALLGLEELLKRLPRELSGGQRQRVALGRALVRRPKLFLFDEPLSNLDAALRTQMRAELKKLHERLKGTFIYVTHDQAEAMTLSDRVVVMNKGEVQQVAPPKELYAHPANLFVATFFGTPRINVLDPKTLDLPNGHGKKVAVRPEHVKVGMGAAPAGGQSGRVFLVEPMGSENWVTLELAHGERVIARASPELDFRVGEPAWMRVPTERLLWFDEASGRGA